MARNRRASPPQQPQPQQQQQQQQPKQQQGSKPDGEQQAKREPVLRNLALIAVVIVGPYALYLLYLWLRLQSGLERAVVTQSTPRQVLVVGTQCSGTSQTAAELQSLGLEVAHETSDALNAFARDGTVSWLHGIRLLEGAPPVQAIGVLCGKLRPHLLHSTQLEPSEHCSYRSQWDACWAVHCAKVFTRHYGCHPECPAPFRRTLLQVRHPVRTVASLVVKYCTDAKPGTLPHEHVLAALEAFFPGVAWRELDGGCSEVFARYWLEYNRAMASRADAVFRVEDTAPCEIARLAGALGEESERRAAVAAACEGKTAAVHRSTPFGTVNRVNTGKLRLEWRDFPEPLRAELQAQAEEFGYKVAGEKRLFPPMA